MDLSRNVIKKYVAVALPGNVTPNDTTVYGTIVGENGKLYVRIDGSDALTPVSSTIDVRDGDRVLVLLKNHEAMVIGSPTSPTARLEELSKLEGDVTKFGVILADKVGVGELVAIQASIDTLTATDVTITGQLAAANAEIDKLKAEDVVINGTLDAYKADIEKLTAADVTITGQLTAASADIENLKANKIDATAVEANYATIENLNATNATIAQLDADKIDASEVEATYATIDKLESDYATIENLNANTANIEKLSADIADIDTLIFGSASGTTIHSNFANAVVAQLGNAQIKSAMIDTVSASKIDAGDISTNTVRVVSDDGRLVISDETIQISDDTRVRVQIGKDASNDYSINIWDVEGNLMFSEGGITDSAIKEAIIRNDMVASNANIDASKLDISSLFTEINESTETIKSTRVYLDDKNQTLDVAFTSMSSDVDGLRDNVKSQGTAIDVIQGKIESKVWQQDINNATGELNTQYSTLKQTLDGVSSTVGTHTTQISDTNTRISTAETAIEQNKEQIQLRATKTELSDSLNNYPTKTDVANTLDNYYTKTDADAAISVESNRIVSSVNERLEFIEIDGRNLLLNSEGEHHIKSTVFHLDISGVGNKKLLNGGTVTLSLDAKADRITNIDAYPRYINDSGEVTAYTTNRPTFSITEEWTRYFATVEFPGRNWCRFSIRSNSSVNGGSSSANVYVKNIKLECGAVATDWSMAPEESTESLLDLATRMDSAESSIVQNASDISLRVTTSSLDETLDNYYTKNETYSKSQTYTKTETDTEIKAAKDSISLSVASTYATIEDVEDIEIGSKNLIRNSRNLIFKDYGFPLFVDYIEVTGTQYIDTGFIPNQDSRIVCEFMFKSGDGIYGTRVSTSANNFALRVIGSKWQPGYIKLGSTDISSDTDKWHIADQNKNVFSIDGVVGYTFGYAEFTGPKTIVLGGINANNKMYYGSGSYRSCQIYNNDTLVRDLRPCFYQGEYGMWDVVEHKFYKNAGSNEIIGGMREASEG